jgi:hypothetical protein
LDLGLDLGRAAPSDTASEALEGAATTTTTTPVNRKKLNTLAVASRARTMMENSLAVHNKSYCP